jgi:voltage-gated potassium channel
MSEALQVSAPPTEVAPIDELSALVTWGAALFYWAEEGVNDGVKTYWDALHYIATSLSVGYANIFPVTPLGKTVGAVVMMVGPALSARALEAPHPESDASPGAVVEKLDAILEELKKLNQR